MVKIDWIYGGGKGKGFLPFSQKFELVSAGSFIKFHLEASSSFSWKLRQVSAGSFDKFQLEASSSFSWKFVKFQLEASSSFSWKLRQVSISSFAIPQNSHLLQTSPKNPPLHSTNHHDHLDQLPSKASIDFTFLFPSPRL
jgi:hypothetical protein